MLISKEIKNKLSEMVLKGLLVKQLVNDSDMISLQEAKRIYGIKLDEKFYPPDFIRVSFSGKNYQLYKIFLCNGMPFIKYETKNFKVVYIALLPESLQVPVKQKPIALKV